MIHYKLIAKPQQNKAVQNISGLVQECSNSIANTLELMWFLR